ncbi:protein IL-40 [Mustela erminea]|uniref:protein IL-40 n=1 Tax=Mustela erminea TaxID=36723 RepID=UPI0013871DEB|nr:protein IL-40 [Mustela erminea]
MWLLLLLCWAVLVTSSFSVEPEVEVTHETFIAYKVLEVFPRGRRVVITCHSPQAPPPVTYSLWAGQGTEVAKKVVKTGDPASFSINITLKSRPDLLTYSCQAASPEGTHSASTNLQMYWELWTKPVSQLQANFTLLDRGSGPRVEISCQVSSGSPPITYSLVGKDGTVHTQQRPNYGQPAKFTFTLTNKSTRLQCQAENDISVQFSPFKLVPPGQLPPGAIVVLGSSLISIAAVTCWLLAQAWWTSSPRMEPPGLWVGRSPVFLMGLRRDDRSVSMMPSGD